MQPTTFLHRIVHNDHISPWKLIPPSNNITLLSNFVSSLFCFPREIKWSFWIVRPVHSFECFNSFSIHLPMCAGVCMLLYFTLSLHFNCMYTHAMCFTGSETLPEGKYSIEPHFIYQALEQCECFVFVLCYWIKILLSAYHICDNRRDFH